MAQFTSFLYLLFEPCQQIWCMHVFYWAWTVALSFRGLFPWRVINTADALTQTDQNFLKIHISWKRVKIHFLMIFELLAKNLKYMTLCWRVKWYLSLMDALGYVSRINLTSALGLYLTPTRSQQWDMLAPIRVLQYCPSSQSHHKIRVLSYVAMESN